jgi:hypothetical protein
MNLKDRLAMIMGAQADKPFGWAKKIGINGATFNRIWNEGGQLKSDHLILIQKKTNVSIDWLLTGRGPMYAENVAPNVDNQRAMEQEDGCLRAASQTNIPADAKPVLDAFVEVMNSGHEGVKQALTQSTFAFQETVRSAKRITALEADIEVIKRHFVPREDDFKTLGQMGESQQRENQRGGGKD